MPDIDLDCDIRELVILSSALRIRARRTRREFRGDALRGAIRDVGKALGLPYADLERLVG